MKKRREECFANFTKKLINSERFSDLFPLNDSINMNLRHRNRYVEEHARSERLYRSPLFAMRRFANENF